MVAVARERRIAAHFTAAGPTVPFGMISRLFSSRSGAYRSRHSYVPRFASAAERPEMRPRATSAVGDRRRQNTGGDGLNQILPVLCLNVKHKQAIPKRQHLSAT